MPNFQYSIDVLGAVGQNTGLFRDIEEWTMNKFGGQYIRMFEPDGTWCSIRFMKDPYIFIHKDEAMWFWLRWG